MFQNGNLLLVRIIFFRNVIDGRFSLDRCRACRLRPDMDQPRSQYSQSVSAWWLSLEAGVYANNRTGGSAWGCARTDVTCRNHRTQSMLPQCPLDINFFVPARHYRWKINFNARVLRLCLLVWKLGQYRSEVSLYSWKSVDWILKEYW